MMLEYLRRELKAAASEPSVAAFLLVSMAGALALGGAVFFSLTVVEFVLLALLWSPVAVFAAASVQMSLARHHGLDKLMLSNPVPPGALLAARAALVLVWSLVALVLMVPPMVAVGAALGPPAWEVLGRGAAAYALLVVSGTVLGSFLALLCARLGVPLAMGAGAGAGLALLALGTAGYQTMTGRRVDPAALALRGPSPWAPAEEILHGDFAAAARLGLLLTVMLALIVLATWALLRHARDAAGWTRPGLAASFVAGLALALAALPALVPAPPVVQHAEFGEGRVGGFAFSIESPEGMFFLEGAGPHAIVLHARALRPAQGEPVPGGVTVSLQEGGLNRPSGLEILEVAPQRQEARIVPDPDEPGAWILEPTTWTVSVRGALSGGKTSTFLLLEVARGGEVSYASEGVEVGGLAPSMTPLAAAAAVDVLLAGAIAWRLASHGKRVAAAATAGG